MSLVPLFYQDLDMFFFFFIHPHYVVSITSFGFWDTLCLLLFARYPRLEVRVEFIRIRICTNGSHFGIGRDRYMYACPKNLAQKPAGPLSLSP